MHRYTHTHTHTQEPIIDQFLTTVDVQSAVTVIERLEGISKETMVMLLITKTLEKSGKR